METQNHITTLRYLEDEIDLDRHRYQQQFNAAPPSSKLQEQLQRIIDLRRNQHDALRHARTLLQSATCNRRTDREAAEQLIAILEGLDRDSLIAWTTMLITNILNGHTVRELIRGYHDASSTGT